MGKSHGPHVRNRLTARQVAALRGIPGRYEDGGGLALRIREKGRAGNWTWRGHFDNRQIDVGCGSADTTSLAAARIKAAECEGMVARGVNPVTAKKAAKAAAKGRRTFAELAVELFGLKRSEWRNALHRRQWLDSLAACKVLGPLYIDEIDPATVLRELQRDWIRTPASASRLRGRIENVLDYGIALGLRQGPNPAAMKGNLAHFLPKRPRLAPRHMPAMPYESVPAFIAGLRAAASPSMSAKVVEFIALTACRTGEAVNALRPEFDLVAMVWTIPPAHTKSGREHRIPLSLPAAAIIEWCDERRTDGNLAFQGRFPGKPLADLIRYMPAGSSVHGLRSAFRDYCGNETSFPREHVEQCLAHQIAGATERAYRRSDALERRREIMTAWAAYLGSAQLALPPPIPRLPLCESPEHAG